VPGSDQHARAPERRRQRRPYLPIDSPKQATPSGMLLEPEEAREVLVEAIEQ